MTDKSNINLRNQINKKWRTKLFRVSALITVFVFVAEVLIFLYNKYFDELFIAEAMYEVRFIVIPSLLNFAGLVITFTRLKSQNVTDREKNVAISMLMVWICGVVECSHYVYAPILCAPCIAIFITIIFADRRITRTISILAFVFLVISVGIAMLELRKGDSRLLIDFLIAVSVTFFSYYTANILAEYQKEINESINSSYKRQNELIEEMKVDGLTGLFNKKALTESIEAKVKNYFGNKKQLNMAIIDIDHFKNVNDTYGHAMGDIVLVELSKLIKMIVKGKASAFRFGGEEFVILFEKADCIGGLCNSRRDKNYVWNAQVQLYG